MLNFKVLMGFVKLELIIKKTLKESLFFFLSLSLSLSNFSGFLLLIHVKYFTLKYYEIWQ